MLALDPEELLGNEADLGSLGTFMDTLAKPIRSGSSWIDGYDGLLALLVNDRFDDTFVLLLGFE